jgi:hypothetical protein
MEAGRVVSNRKGIEMKVSDRPLLTNDLLRQLYVDDRLSQHQIAAQYGLDQSTVCRRLQRAGIPTRLPGDDQRDIESFYRKRDRKRFWSKVRRGGPNECWEWAGYKKAWHMSHGVNQGYGSMNFNGMAKLAHRVSWEISNNRPVPDGLKVLHRCDNPGCCNPAHLFLGTMQDNAIDRTQKGRNNRPPGYLKNRRAAS